MKHTPRKPSPTLLALNLVLLTAVLSLALSPYVGAAPQPGRARGSYTMVSGKIQGGSNDVVYLLDAANQELVSLGWDTAKKELFIIGYRSLAADSHTRNGPR